MEAVKRVIFVCIENSNRSQMAQAFARMHGGSAVEAHSAGSRPSGRVNPKAVEAMRELGYDLTTHHSKGLAEFTGVEFDAAVTMGCGDECPFLVAKRRIDWNIPDPREMPPEEFRKVRDLIGAKVQELLTELGAPTRNITEAVRAKYGAVAASSLSSEHDGVRAVAEAFGYSTEELSSLPAEANMGLSCGNPTAFASLKPGETVVDLGCGGGLDVLLAAVKVGPTGKAIGIDMTPEMLERARRNAARGVQGKPVSNAEFHHATIDQLPLPDASVDCVISNCVINLAPDKSAVFREIARVLKPGGRLAVSDIALKKPLPPEAAEDLMAYVGCIAGAISLEEYQSGLLDAGFAHVQVTDAGSDLNAYKQVHDQPGCCSRDPEPAGGLTLVATSCCAPTDGPFHRELSSVLERIDVNEYAASVRVFAVKPV